MCSAQTSFLPPSCPFFYHQSCGSGLLQKIGPVLWAPGTAKEIGVGCGREALRDPWESANNVEKRGGREDAGFLVGLLICRVEEA